MLYRIRDLLAALDHLKLQTIKYVDFCLYVQVLILSLKPAWPSDKKGECEMGHYNDKAKPVN